MFGRNLLIARLLPVEDYGIAATFAMLFAAVEAFSQIGLDRMLIQDRDGDRPAMQRGLHAFSALRGLAAAAAILALAAPYAGFLGVPQAAGAYAAMALMPLMRGGLHYDVFRLQRRMDYRIAIRMQIVPAAVSLASIWPLVVVLGDWRAMPAALLLQEAARVATSHLAAERGYRIGWDGALVRRALGFGWPLFANGLLLFLVFNGEKMLVGRTLGMAELGLFAMAVTLTLTPSFVLARAAQAYFLPRLSRLQDAPAAFARLYPVAVQTGMAIGLGVLGATLLLGAPFVHLALGEHFRPMLPTLAALAAVNAVRLAKTGIAVVSLARGFTGNAAIANLPRAAALAPAWAALAAGHGIEAVLAIALAAETAGLAVALGVLRARLGVPLAPLLLPLAAFAGAVTLAWIAGRALDPDLSGAFSHLGAEGPALLPAAIAAAALAPATFGALRRYALRRGRI